MTHRKAVVATALGALAGEYLGERHDVRVFRGVPYAAPPVGDRRWRPPAPAAPWTGVRDAAAYGASCAQLGNGGRHSSEDCLYLNIWTPASSSGDLLPVMVWVHGGWFASGSGSSRTYRGEQLARHGVVAVTFNYRLGAFGFMAHPALSAEDEADTSGNYGLLDMIAALRWIRENISAFGGDPDCVTLFGQSAGGSAVTSLMSTPRTSQLFHRAIAQSTGTALIWPRHLRERCHGLEPAEEIGVRHAMYLGIESGRDAAAQLRAKSADEIAALPDPEFQFRPNVDRAILPEAPRGAFLAGRQHAVPLITGANANEGSMFVPERPDATPQWYFETLRKLFGDRADDVRDRYPAETPAEIHEALVRVRTDWRFITGARVLAKRHSAVSQTFLYYFTASIHTLNGRKFGTHHGAEMPFVFGTHGSEDPETARISETMMRYWVAFARTGDPNQPDLPAWPAYNADRDPWLEIGSTIAVRESVRRENLDLFEQLA